MMIRITTTDTTVTVMVTVIPVEGSGKLERNEFVEGILGTYDSLVPAPVVERMIVPGETSEVADVTVVATVVPTAKINNVYIHKIIEYKS